MASEKTLTILRHAKAEAGSASQNDHERALTHRGIEACHVIGEYMAKQGLTFDRVLCSTAVRARQTWEEVQRFYKTSAPTAHEKKLYLASGNEILNLLSHMPEPVNSLLIIGHNPGLHQLAVKLAGTGDSVLLDRLALKFPTCALAGLMLDPPWKKIPHARGRLLEFITPKMLSGGDDD
jgi:phosphohistidine phosphatase